MKDPELVLNAGALLGVGPVWDSEAASLETEVPYRYHAAIAEAVDLPLILFQLKPAPGGVLYSAEILQRLVSIPTVAAIKEASFDAVRFLPVKAALADVIFAPPVTDDRARTKEALRMPGVLETATVRPPLLPISEPERAVIRQALMQAGLLA